MRARTQCTPIFFITFISLSNWFASDSVRSAPTDRPKKSFVNGDCGTLG